MSNVCGCKNCDLPVVALGMCVKHWRRVRKYGTPFATVRHAMHGLSVEERFDRMHRKDGPNGCWLWTGTVDHDGYGIFTGNYDGLVYRRAHRYSWAFHAKGQVPEGMFVCHSCDTPGCVNPDHLWLGTVAENHEDMDAKGRRRAVRRGNQSARALLAEANVEKILVDARPYAEIAQEYGVAVTTITSIKNRVSWAHVKVNKIIKNKRGSGSGHRGKSDRITPDIVRTIRASSDQGKLLAERFQVSPQLITAIRKRRRWAHVE